MTQGKIPPEIARKLAQMGKAQTTSAPPPAAPSRAMPAKLSSGPAAAPPANPMAKLAAAGWLVAALAIVVAVGEYYWFAADKQSALTALSAEHEVQLQRSKLEAEERLQKILADTEASQQVLQTELDFQRMPALPLKLVFRPGGVLYVESEATELFSCKVRLLRPATAARAELDFSINARTFKDLGAIDSWVLTRGDQIEFVKAGYKPWKGEVL